MSETNPREQDPMDPSSDIFWDPALLKAPPPPPPVGGRGAPSYSLKTDINPAPCVGGMSEGGIHFF